MSVMQLVLDMSFSHRVSQLRKDKGLTQQDLADKVGVRVLQIRRYESASSQPTLDVIKNMAIAFGVTSDELIFGLDGRRPPDDLKLQFEAIGQFDEEERKVTKILLESLILKHNAKRAFSQELQTSN